MRALAIGIAVLVLAVVITLVMLDEDAGDAKRAAASSCTEQNAGVPAGTESVKPRVVLQPDANSQARVVNFGNDRDPETLSFAVKSDRPLPEGLEGRLGLTADTFTRTGSETAESVTFPEPTFSELRPARNRERVRFKVCLAPPGDLPAGRYTGLVVLDGPAGVEGTTVTITANAKDERLFFAGLGLTLLFAAVVLLYKGASNRRAASIADSNTPEAKKAAESWRLAFRGTATDMGWLAPTIFAIGATAGTLFALYESDPAWGESGLSSVAALIGAGLAAIGAKAIFSPSK